MMQEHGMHVEESRQIHELLVTKFWDEMTEDQKIGLIKRMIEGKILIKENMIELIEHEIDTIKMMKEFISESEPDSE
nr:hypothetical protein [uncultured Methanoregula sp.]